MRKKLLSLFGILGSLMFVVATAHAAEVFAEANIPFAFEVGNVSLPAGAYTIAKEQPPTGAYLIRSQDGAHADFFSAITAQPTFGKDPEWALVFDKVGDKYFLRHVWLGSAETGLGLPKSKLERKSLAMGKVESRIEVAELGH